VAIDAVVTEVQGSADEPFGGAYVAFNDLGEGGEPVEFGGGFGPEGFGFVDAAAVEGLVLSEGADVSFGGEVCGNGEDTVLAEEGLHLVAGGGAWGGTGHAAWLLGTILGQKVRYEVRDGQSGEFDSSVSRCAANCYGLM